VTYEAYLVIARDGFRAVFLERARAERYAADTHGIIIVMTGEG
jgi:hypothetical protein